MSMYLFFIDKLKEKMCHLFNSFSAVSYKLARL